MRKVMGASAAGIAFRLSEEFIQLVLVAIVIAVPAIYAAMNNWLEGFAFHTSIEIETFILAGNLALIIATLTVMYQTSRAASANPVDSLRSE